MRSRRVSAGLHYLNPIFRAALADVQPRLQYGFQAVRNLSHYQLAKSAVVENHQAGTRCDRARKGDFARFANLFRAGLTAAIAGSAVFGF